MRPAPARSSRRCLPDRTRVAGTRRAYGARRTRHAALVVCLAVAALAPTGCVRVPQASVDLADSLTGMIRSARRSHLALIDAYVEQRRVTLDTWMEHVWIPRFLATGIADADLWARLQAEPDDAARGRLLLEFATDAQVQIDRRRRSLHAQLGRIAALMRAPVRAHYDDMLATSQSLAAHLRSAAEVAATREALLEQLDLDVQAWLPVEALDEVFEQVEGFRGDVEELEDLLERAVEILTRER